MLSTPILDGGIGARLARLHEGKSLSEAYYSALQFTGRVVLLPALAYFLLKPAKRAISPFWEPCVHPPISGELPLASEFRDTACV